MNGRELFLHQPWVFDDTHLQILLVTPVRYKICSIMQTPFLILIGTTIASDGFTNLSKVNIYAYYIVSDIIYFVLQVIQARSVIQLCFSCVFVLIFPCCFSQLDIATVYYFGDFDHICIYDQVYIKFDSNMNNAKLNLILFHCDKMPPK